MFFLLMDGDDVREWISPYMVISAPYRGISRASNQKEGFHKALKRQTLKQVILGRRSNEKKYKHGAVKEHNGSPLNI